MEIRDMQYFLSIAQEGSISGAANALHVAQPSLSRQMKALEDELGKTLFIRGSRRVTLTEEGMILRKRAEEMLSLMEKTEKELSASTESISGDIYIGAAESKSVHYLTKTFSEMQKTYSDIHLHIASGDTSDLLYQLEQGLIDFALLFYIDDLEKYNYLRLPASDSWGVLMRKDHHLAKKKALTFERDLLNEPLIMSRQTRGEILPGIHSDSLNIVATYNLAYNASIMVNDGIGIALCFDSINNLNSSNNKNLIFVPLDLSMVDMRPILVWKKYQVLSRISKTFINEVDATIENAL